MDIEIESFTAPQTLVSAADNSLRIFLSRATDPQLANFWIGLYKSQGTGSSQTFLATEKFDEAFRYLSEVGLPDNQPLMYSDNSGAIHRQFFLLPQAKFIQDTDAGRDLVLSTIESLGQKKIGLYLAPGVFNHSSTHDILAELLEGLAKLKTEEVYLLTTDIGINQLLNVSLEVKQNLKNRRDVWIFH